MQRPVVGTLNPGADHRPISFSCRPLSTSLGHGLPTMPAGIQFRDAGRRTVRFYYYTRSGMVS